MLDPAKITSSMSAARRDLCEVSPITQRSASTRFDLPQPFGPTTPVRPGSIRKSVGSTKDLKPSRRSRVSFMPSSFQAEKDQGFCQLHQNALAAARKWHANGNRGAAQARFSNQETPHRGGQ